MIANLLHIGGALCLVSIAGMTGLALCRCFRLSDCRHADDPAEPDTDAVFFADAETVISGDLSADLEG